MALRFGLQGVVGVIILFVISWKLSLVIFLIIPIIGGIAVVYGKFIRRVSKAVQDALAEVRCPICFPTHP